MFNVAVDGLGGCGKSTVAQGIAERLKFKVLNTGAIYRALACAYLDMGLGELSDKRVNEFACDLEIDVFFEGKDQHVIVNGKDYTPFLRKEEISKFSSMISPYPQLREVVRRVQKDFAKKHNCIIEGRGIGIDVLPDADLKFFLTATPEVRAMRRYVQIKDTPNAPTFDDVLADLNARDYADEHREHGTNIPAKDAVILDTTNLTLEESLDIVEEIVRKRIKNKKQS